MQTPFPSWAGERKPDSLLALRLLTKQGDGTLLSEGRGKKENAEAPYRHLGFTDANASRVTTPPASSSPSSSWLLEVAYQKRTPIFLVILSIYIRYSLCFPPLALELTEDLRGWVLHDASAVVGTAWTWLNTSWEFYELLFLSYLLLRPQVGKDGLGSWVLIDKELSPLGLSLVGLLQVGSWEAKDGVVWNWSKNLPRNQKPGIWCLSLAHNHGWRYRKRGKRALITVITPKFWMISQWPKLPKMFFFIESSPLDMNEQRFEVGTITPTV